MIPAQVELTDEDVELLVGCPNARCFVESGEPCVDADGAVVGESHRARRRLAESVERDARELGGLPEHDPRLSRRR